MGGEGKKKKKDRLTNYIVNYKVILGLNLVVRLLFQIQKLVIGHEGIIDDKVMG